MRELKRIGIATTAYRRRRCRVPRVRDNFGLVIDSFQVLARHESPAALAAIPGDKIFLAQLLDHTLDMTDVMEASRHHRVFPGERRNDQTMVDVVSALEAAGYRGDYTLKVFNDDCLTLAPAEVAARAHKSAVWICSRAARRAPA
jgi:sugar phosphate isomerase/epimerase